MSKIAVVILNLGGPDSPEAVEPFLYNLFQDKDIFKIPFGQKLFAKLISSRRAPKVVEEYKLIGGNSPINKWTEIQREKLETELSKDFNDVKVITGMRYWHPLIKDVAEELANDSYDKVILLPLYPHHSISTTGSSFNEWNRFYKNDTGKIIYINEYPTNQLYISAINERIDQGLLKFDENIRKDVQLVFSAHGTPISMVKSGDPYSIHINETVAEVMKDRENSHEHHLCFQSKVGPVKWLEPATDDMIKKLSSEEKKHLLIIPISFVSDHVETAFELDIEYRHVADEAGIRNYIVMEGLNDSDKFIEALKKEVQKVL